MLEEIIIAIRAYGMAHRFIMKHRLWKWIIIPGIIYAIFFGTGFYFFWQSSAHVIDYFFSKTGLKTSLQHEGGGWLRFMFIFGQLVLHLILMLLYFSWFKYLILIIGSPVFVWLSGSAEAIIQHKSANIGSAKFLKNALRGITVAVRNSLWQTFFIICILFLSLIPVVGWASPVLAVFMECYYFGFSMMDYTNGREGLTISYSSQFINGHKGLPIGNGMIFYLMHVAIIVGWILAPGYAIIAATLSLQDESGLDA